MRALTPPRKRSEVVLHNGPTGPHVYYVPEVGWYALAFVWSWAGPPEVTVDRGFTYDLASIPRALRWLVAPHEIGLAAPLVHDYLYRHGGVTRLEADRALLRLMIEDRVPPARRWMVYRGVRAGGWWAWRRARRAD